MPKRHSTLISSAWLLLAFAIFGGLSLARSTPSEARIPSVSCQLGPAGQAQPQVVAPQSLPFRGTYTVDVYGGTAVVTLVQEFTNRSEDEQRFDYHCELQAPGQFVKLELNAAGFSQLVPSTAAVMEENTDTTSRSRKRKAATPVEATPFETTWQSTRLDATNIVVDGEEPFVLQTVFRMPLPVQGRLFKLTLPTVTTGMIDSTPDARTANPTDSPLPVHILVNVHHDQPLSDLDSGTHELLSNFVGDRTLVETVAQEIPGNQRFDLAFALNAEDTPTVATYVRTGPDGRQGIEAVLTPPEVNRNESVRPKQILFIVDRSGSMSHQEKLVQARKAVAYCVEALTPSDRFNIIQFDNSYALLRPEPVDRQVIGMEAVNGWLDTLKPGGGTTLLPALEATLKQPDDPDRHRMVVLVTDGLLADEKEVLALLEEELGDGRLFVVGTGTQINRPTLLRLAEFGKGAATFAGDSKTLETAVTELFDSISQPVGWDLDFGLRAAGAVEVTPSRMPDLYTGRGVRVLAWFQDELPSELQIRMATMDGEQRFRVRLPARSD